MGRPRKTTEQFIKESKQTHGDRYDYSLSDYIGIDNTVKIICPIHNDFEQNAGNHLRGGGCPECKYVEYRKRYHKGIEQFINESIELHGDLYDYKDFIYKNRYTTGKIICKKHGEFYQQPRYHLSGNGCPQCNASKGERKISKYLEEQEIDYIVEKRFNDCKDVNTLPFDFYLPKQNTCIEYDGEQHFLPVEHFGGEHSLTKRKLRDNIKTEYCKINGITLIRIPYTETNIEEILRKHIQ